ncbi:hypothetical protein IRJ41_002543 [Triplophysa rosa]|uniref:Uncharacterized protein n=1 Tax=Triplophysa rosa TaxID=992332 RepID=A0A9W7T811_TRIRA|nr:hypothetical protein IRJ41_002543 [Triplophysa rosa]
MGCPAHNPPTSPPPVLAASSRALGFHLVIERPAQINPNKTSRPLFTSPGAEGRFPSRHVDETWHSIRWINPHDSSAHLITASVNIPHHHDRNTSAQGPKSRGLYKGTQTEWAGHPSSLSLRSMTAEQVEQGIQVMVAYSGILASSPGHGALLPVPIVHLLCAYCGNPERAGGKQRHRLCRVPALISHAPGIATDAGHY